MNHLWFRAHQNSTRSTRSAARQAGALSRGTRLKALWKRTERARASRGGRLLGFWRPAAADTQLHPPHSKPGPGLQWRYTSHGMPVTLLQAAAARARALTLQPQLQHHIADLRGSRLLHRLGSGTQRGTLQRMRGCDTSPTTSSTTSAGWGGGMGGRFGTQTSELAGCYCCLRRHMPTSHLPHTTECG